MFIPIRPPPPGDSPPPPFRTQLIYLVAFLSAVLLIVGAAVRLRAP